MSDKSDDQEGDIFDNIDSSNDSTRSLQNVQSAQTKNDPINILKKVVSPKLNKEFVLIDEKGDKVKQKLPDIPLPILEGAHSLGPDMKFGWKPEVDFESAPIPLYFNFLENPHQQFYEEQAYYSNSNGKLNKFKIIYYGPRFKDSFEMHRNFVKPAESTYEFNFPKIFGQSSAKAFFDGIFEEMMDGEAPSRDEMREFQGMSPDIDWNEICFNSNFENGNLDMVVKTGENSYDLFLRVDTNTRGHTNWFHFEVSRTRKNKTVQFNIVNMSKKDALFNYGMQINYWSQKKNSPNFCGWERGGQNIKYSQTSSMKQSFQSNKKKFYTLSFEFKFEHDNDKVWFAYTIPYSYSMCIQYIRSIVQEQKNWINYENARAQEEEANELQKPLKKRGKVLQESLLCKTLGGVDVPLLTITNFDESNWQKSRQIVFIQSRIHPGETSSSWIVHGLITFLISRSKIADELRKRFVFKIIPMLNPDGVIIGNSRATLLGLDMNRQFMDNPEMDPKLNPVPIAIKDLIASIIKEDKDKILAFIDLHQHSKKKSIFVYGPYYPLHTDKYLKIRIIPKLLSERSEYFRFFSSRFQIEKYKENCARITLGKQFNIVNCFTLECSSYGYITKDRTTFQFKESDLIEFGKSLAECLLEYELIMDRDRKIKDQIKERIRQKKLKRKAIKEYVGDQTSKAQKPKEEIQKEVNSSDENDSDESDMEESGSNDDDENFTEEYMKKKKEIQIQKNLIIDQSKDNLEVDLESQDDDDEDRFYSDEEDPTSSPVSKPSDLKGLLKHKQKKSKFDLKAYSATAGDGKHNKIRTLDQILGMIQNDIIHEESEDDSNRSIGSKESDQEGSDSSDGDNLDLQDQQVLKDRILHAIQVFSKWSPNPKKELLKQKRKNKLSIENRSRASSRRSNGSDSNQNLMQVGDQNEIIMNFKDSKTPSNQNQRYKFNKKQYKDQNKQAVDNFLKEIGFLSGNQNSLNKFSEPNSIINNLDDDQLSSISNEILKQRKKQLKKQKKQGGKTQGDLLMVKSFGTNKNKKNQGLAAQSSMQSSQDYFKIGNKESIASEIQSKQISHQNSARKIVLLKYSNGQDQNQKKLTKTVGIDNEQSSNSNQMVQNKITSQIEVKKEPLAQKLLGFSNDQQNVHIQQHQKQQQQDRRDEVPKSSHLFGYDNKLALLEEAIANHKRQRHHEKQKQQVIDQQYLIARPKTSYIKYHRQNRSIQQYIQYRASSQISNQLKLPPKSKQIHIPSLKQSPANQIQATQYNQSKLIPQNINGSFDNVPPPFFSCQIQPQPQRESPAHLKQKKYNNFQNKQNNKVNAATDTNTNQNRIVQLQFAIGNLDQNGSLLENMSQQSHRQSPKFNMDDNNYEDQFPKNTQLISNHNHSRSIDVNLESVLNSIALDQNQIESQTQRDEMTINYLQLPINPISNHKVTTGFTISDSSYAQSHNQSIENNYIIPNAQGNTEGQILSGQNRQYKLFQKIGAKTSNLENKVSGNLAKEKDKSLQEYLDSQQIGLQQWMRLKDKGFIPKNPYNQLLVTNAPIRQINNSQLQVSIQKEYDSLNTSIERRPSILLEKPQMIGYLQQNANNFQSSSNKAQGNANINRQASTTIIDQNNFLNNVQSKAILHFRRRQTVTRVDDTNIKQFLASQPITTPSSKNLNQSIFQQEYTGLNGSQQKSNQKIQNKKPILSQDFDKKSLLLQKNIIKGRPLSMMEQKR